MATNFPRSARRDDPNGYMVVQSNLEWLRDAFDAFVAKFKQGTALILAGNTSVVVTHNFGSTAYQAFAAPDPTEAGGRWWISGKTATQFTINLTGAAPAGGSPFDWILKGT